MLLFFISVTIFFFVIVLGKLIYIKFRKEEIQSIFNYKLLINGISAFLFWLIFALLIFFLYGSYDSSNLIWLAFIIDFIVFYVDFGRLFYKKKAREKVFVKANLRRILSISSICLILIFDFFIANADRFKQNYNTVNYDITEIAGFNNNGTLTDKGIDFEFSDYIDINSSESIKNIYIECNRETLNAHVDIFAKDTNGEFYLAKSIFFNPMVDDTLYLDVSDIDDTSVLGLHFYYGQDNHVDKYMEDDMLTITSISLNKEKTFSFSFARFVILFIIINIFIYLPLFIKKFFLNSTNLFSKIEAVIGIVSVFVILSFIIYTLCNKDSYYVLYSNINLNDTNIYYRYFDSIFKHRLSLDLRVSDSLKALENPYAYPRPASYYWDHAYYNGAYYCYYGVVPVLITMFPLYFLSGGYLPSLVLMELVGVMLLIPFLLLALLEVIKTFCKKINYPTLAFILFVAIFVSGAFLNVTYKYGSCYEGIYHIPYGYGLAFILAFLFFTFKSYNDKERRMMWLIFAGLSLILTIESRPNLALYALITIPLFLKMLLNKDYTWKKRIIDFAPALGIIILGGIGVCAYNYARFDSIFEFGQFYQLTLTDNSNLSLKANGILPALGHFFFQPIAFDKEFPYVIPSSIVFGNEPHSYCWSIIGIFSVPIFLLSCILAIPYFRKEKDWWMKSIVIIIPIILFVIAFTTSCYAGVCIRYIADIFPLATIFMAIMVMRAVTDLEHAHKKICVYFVYITGLVSIYIGFALLFNNTNGITAYDLNGIYYKLKEIFFPF